MSSPCKTTVGRPLSLCVAYVDGEIVLWSFKRWFYLWGWSFYRHWCVVLVLVYKLFY